METAEKKYITDLDFASEFKGEKLLRLDIGCGMDKKEGFVGVDFSSDSQADIFHDLDIFPWPFDPDSVFEIYCAHYIEHCADLIKFMDECYRILKNQSVIMITAPYYTSMRTWQDPTHKRAISEATFTYFNKIERERMKISHYPIKCNFKAESLKYIVEPEWLTRSPQAVEWARKHYCNVVTDLEMVLRKI